MGGTAFPTALSYRRSPMGGSGAACGTVWCRVRRNRGPEARLFGAPSWTRMDRRDAGDGAIHRCRNMLGVQKFRLTQFSFSLLYINRADYRWVAAVAHGSRKPGCWK